MAKYTAAAAALHSELDIPIHDILIDHDPDGRALDSQTLLRLIDNIMHHTIKSQDYGTVNNTDASEFELEELDHSSIWMISNEILGKCYRKRNSNAITVEVLALLGRYRWDAKLVLALSAFATQYGQFHVVMQSKTRNPLAAWISLLKRFPRNELRVFDPVFEALGRLVDDMVELIRSVARFEVLPVGFLEVRGEGEGEGDAVAAAKKLVYVAGYWVVRSIVHCILLLTDLRDIEDDRNEQDFRDSYAVPGIVWEIISLKIKIVSISTQLVEQVDICEKQTEKEMHTKLLNLSHETHSDNQEILRILFASRDDLPLKRSDEFSQVAISSLKSKVVILLISKPELLPVEQLFLLVQQTYDLDERYAILWVPISDSEQWGNNEVTIFNILSDSLPWYSIRQPWLLSSTTIKYAKEEWGFNEKPVMVILDSVGKISNVNAVDMVWTWGSEAYPFSSSRENELWEDEKWSLGFLLGKIDPLLTMWVDQERILCIYASRKLDWIRDFTAEIREIQSLVPELEVVYVGKNGHGHSNLDDSNIVSVIKKEKLSKSLTLNKIHLMWHRLESMKRSKLISLGCTADNTTDHILQEIEALLSSDEQIIIGKGKGCSTDMVRLNGNEWHKLMDQSSLWKKNVSRIGLVNAIRVSLETLTVGPCSHPRVVRYEEGLMDETLVCGKCKHLIQRSVVYDAGRDFEHTVM